MPTEDFLAHPDTLDELVQIHAGLNAHTVQHVHDILGGRHAGGLTIAAVGTPTHTANGALNAQRIVRPQRPDGSIHGRDRHPPAVVQVRPEVLDVGPLFFDAAKNFLDFDGMTPPHRVADTDCSHLNTRRSPEVMLFFEKLHHRVDLLYVST